MGDEYWIEEIMQDTALVLHDISWNWLRANFLFRRSVDYCPGPSVAIVGLVSYDMIFTCKDIGLLR